jgi:streptogramin lyase
MRTSRVVSLFLLGIAAAVTLLAMQSSSESDTSLGGAVKSTDAKPLEGIAVSARAVSKTFTVSVYTDRNGEYFFPVLGDGEYTVWAHAVGFKTGAADVNISAGKRTAQDFTLQPLEDFSKQLSGAEWFESLPEGTPQDREMKALFQHNCTSCHIASSVLDHRFDAAGWGNILNMMSKIGVYAFTPEDPQHPANPSIRSHREQLVSYMTRVRGPQSSPLKFTPFPRPTGEAAQVIVTEYDIAPGDKPGVLPMNDGTQWSETPAAYEGRSIHDLLVGRDHNVWFGNTIPLGRTIGKLDPKTGQVTGYAMPEANNKPVNARGLVQDRDGNIWFSDKPRSGPEPGGLVRFNPKTEQFQLLPRPLAMPRLGDFPAMDSAGNIWLDAPDGAMKWDAKTEKYTRYKTAATTGKKPYECDVDAKDNVWCAMMETDRLVVIDSHTGQVSEIHLPPLEGEISEKAQKTAAPLSGNLSTSPVYQKGPRRLGTDRRGNTVWVALFFGDRIAKIDIDTRKVTEYRVPRPGSTPYDIVVDKNHMVWIELMNADRFVKFNPFTEQFTEYPLPTLGTEARQIAIDDSTDPPTVWLPYYRVNKIARVQFRTTPPH